MARWLDDRVLKPIFSFLKQQLLLNFMLQGMLPRGIWFGGGHKKLDLEASLRTEHCL